MRRILFALATASLLVACQTSAPVPTEDQAAPSSESMDSQQTVFTGNATTVDLSRSSIRFVAGSSIVDHPGVFDRFTASLSVDPMTPADFTKASLAVTVDLTSAKTDSSGLDGHLQREDFFNTAMYPQATFVSTAVTMSDDGTYRIAGDFTLKGQTRSVTAVATVTDTELRATFDVPRKDFGVGNDSYGDKLLDLTVPVTVVLALQ